LPLLGRFLSLALSMLLGLPPRLLLGERRAGQFPAGTA